MEAKLSHESELVAKYQASDEPLTAAEVAWLRARFMNDDRSRVMDRACALVLIDSHERLRRQA